MPQTLSLALAALSLTLTPSIGHSQAYHGRVITDGIEVRPPSHVPLPPAPGDLRDTEQLFQDRFQQSDLLSKLRGAIQGMHPMMDPEQALQKLKNAGVDPKSPEFKKLMVNELAKLTPEQKKLIKELLPKEVLPQGPPPKIETLPSTTPPPEVKPPVESGNLPPSEPTTSPSPNTASGAADTRRREVYQWLFDKLQGMDGLGKSAMNSPTVRDMVHDLGEIAMKAATNVKNTGGGENGWLDQDWPLLRNLNLSRLSNLPAPSANMSLPNPPSLPLPSTGLGGAAWEFVLWPMLFALVAVIVWKALRLPVPFRARAATEEWRLGPWPVRPEAVSTRDQLVRGFEYLSLLRLGKEAQAWHHHAIAGQLGGSEAEKQRAAASLAEVYEKARYAPEHETIDPAMISAARRDLCLLAGKTVV
jgi:hypothetical protein